MIARDKFFISVRIAFDYCYCSFFRAKSKAFCVCLQRSAARFEISVVNAVSVALVFRHNRFDGNAVRFDQVDSEYGGVGDGKHK